MPGTLYVIGVGPGDPELLTLKAARVLREVTCICVPKGREEGSSLALSIVKKAVDLDGKEIIEAYFPMRKTTKQKPAHRSRSTEKEGSGSASCELDAKWNETAETVMSILAGGIDMAFITIGDPTIYSTFFYLYDRLLELNPGLAVEIIPGVSSINASAARAEISLGLADEKVAIVPATYADSLKGVLEAFDTVVLMKVHKVLDRIIQALDVARLTEKAVYISRAGMSDERIIRNIREVKESDLNYFSIVIVRK
ncbi:MAG: precorrin-2 C(20)-methyltransferase [Nitrospirae bacterium]|nr:precorrin-2 C(20)-methyltransferase [Nitrospirota bacterium]